MKALIDAIDKRYMRESEDGELLFEGAASDPQLWSHEPGTRSFRKMLWDPFVALAQYKLSRSWQELIDEHHDLVVGSEVGRLIFGRRHRQSYGDGESKD